MKKFILFSLFLLITGTFFTVVRAQDKQDTTQAVPVGIRGELIKDIQDVQDKIVSLAQAMPPEKYVWRPMEGIRSVSEVFMHIAESNYMFPSVAGVPKPEGLSNDMEKTVTDKNEIINILTQSFDFIKKAIVNTSDADLEKPIKMFGQETTIRAVYLTAATHMHEHLGQSIAYARMNTIVPPWTAKEQEEMAKKKADGNK